MINGGKINSINNLIPTLKTTHTTGLEIRPKEMCQNANDTATWWDDSYYFVVLLYIHLYIDIVKLSYIYITFVINIRMKGQI